MSIRQYSFLRTKTPEVNERNIIRLIKDCKTNQSEIAEILEVSRSAVTQVVTGYVKNGKIVRFLETLAIARQAPYFDIPEEFKR